MKKYLSYFRIRFINGLQYRIAAYAGVATQFAWGFMEILLYNALQKSNPAAFPMELSQLNSYMWLRQALLGLFAAWFFDSETLDMVTSGNVAYELCRPINIYAIWFTKDLATRTSKAALRCIPIFAVAFFLPENLRMYPPESPLALLLFVVSAIMGVLIMVGVTMWIYGSAFYTVSTLGVRIIAMNVIEFFSGALIPIPFFPDSFQRFMSILPFASTQSTPFLIYGGSLTGRACTEALLLQLFWIVVIIGGGALFFRRASRRIVVMGG